MNRKEFSIQNPYGVNRAKSSDSNIIDITDFVKEVMGDETVHMVPKITQTNIQLMAEEIERLREELERVRFLANLNFEKGSFEEYSDGFDDGLEFARSERHAKAKADSWFMIHPVTKEIRWSVKAPETIPAGFKAHPLYRDPQNWFE